MEVHVYHRLQLINVDLIICLKLNSHQWANIDWGLVKRLLTKVNDRLSNLIDSQLGNWQDMI